jgi:hypothetical protein
MYFYRVCGKLNGAFKRAKFASVYGAILNKAWLCRFSLNTSLFKKVI